MTFSVSSVTSVAAVAVWPASQERPPWPGTCAIPSLGKPLAVRPRQSPPARSGHVGMFSA